MGAATPRAMQVLAKGDVLWFAGDLEGLTGLRKIPGLKPHVDEQVEKITDDRLTVRSASRVPLLLLACSFAVSDSLSTAYFRPVHAFLPFGRPRSEARPAHALLPQRRLVQAVVAPGELVGKTVRDARFRTRFNAAIIAVHRRGCRLRMRVGDIELEVREERALRHAHISTCLFGRACGPHRTPIHVPHRAALPSTSDAGPSSPTPCRSPRSPNPATQPDPLFLRRETCC